MWWIIGILSGILITQILKVVIKNKRNGEPPNFISSNIFLIVGVIICVGIGYALKSYILPLIQNSINLNYSTNPTDYKNYIISSWIISVWIPMVFFFPIVLINIKTKRKQRMIKSLNLIHKQVNELIGQ